MNTRFFFFCCLFLGYLSPAVAIDLVESYQLARNYDPTYASAAFNYEAAIEIQPQALSNLLPTIGLSGSIYRQHADVDSPTNSYNRWTSSRGWSLNLAQPLLDVQSWIYYDQSKLYVLQSATTLEEAKQNLILRVAQAYFDVALAKETLIYTQMQKSAIMEQLESAKLRFEVGTATITDTNEAQASYDTIVAEEIRVQTDLDNKRYALQLLIGQPYDDVYLLRSDVLLPEPSPASPNFWVDVAQTNAWNVKYYVLNNEIAKKQVDYARAGHYPTVDLVASQGWDRNAAAVGYSGHSTNRSSQIGIQLSMPIFQGGYTTSRVREAQALSLKADRDLAAAKLDASQNARESFLAVSSGRAEVEALEQALRSSEIALESNKLGYEVGVRINQDVLDAQTQVYQARRALAEARITLLLSQLNLKAAVGDLHEEDLVSIDRFLNKTGIYVPE